MYVTDIVAYAMIFILFIPFFWMAKGIYMRPAAIGKERGIKSAKALWVFNLCLGWTFLGWVLAFVWAFAALPQGGVWIEESGIVDEKAFNNVRGFKKP